jgi:hypothetical protein
LPVLTSAVWMKRHTLGTKAFHTRYSVAGSLVAMASSISSKDAAELAGRLQLDLDDIGICHACLSFVSMPLGWGDERETRRATFAITPDLWNEGLAEPARLALERARAEGIAGAEAGLADVDAREGRSVTARAIVRRLAADLSARAKGDLMRMGFKPWPPPELRPERGGGSEGSARSDIA